MAEGIEDDVMPPISGGLPHDNGGFAEQPYQAAMHRQRRTDASTITYSLLLCVSLVFAPLLYPPFAAWGHFTLWQSGTLAALMVGVMVAAREVWLRRGAASAAYKWTWRLEATLCNFGFLYMAWVGQDHGFGWWLVYIIQVFLIAMEDITTRFPMTMFAVGPVVVAIAYALKGDFTSAAWALTFGCCAEVMCIEVRKIGRRLSAEVRERQALAARVVELHKHQERTRIARDLHDGLAAELTALSFKVDSLSRKSGEPAVRTVLDEVGGRVQQAVDELRSVVWAMRVPAQAFDEVGEYLRSRCAELCGERVCLTFEAVDRSAGEPLNGELRVAMARLVLEGVRNAVRHGSPKTVTVRIERETELRVSVQDDGCGLPAASERRSGGLSNMRARVQTLGGQLDISSDPAAGTRLSSVLPLRRLSAETSSSAPTR
jgi:signal transduction histidine kinase